MRSLRNWSESNWVSVASMSEAPDVHPGFRLRFGFGLGLWFEIRINFFGTDHSGKPFEAVFSNKAVYAKEGGEWKVLLWAVTC